MGKSSPVRARARKFQKELFSHFMALILANTVVRNGVQVHQLLPSFGPVAKTSEASYRLYKT